MAESFWISVLSYRAALTDIFGFEAQFCALKVEQIGSNYYLSKDRLLTYKLDFCEV